MYNDILNTSQAAQLLLASQQTAIRAIDEGTLKGWRVPGSKQRRVGLSEVIDTAKKHDIPFYAIREYLERNELDPVEYGIDMLIGTEVLHFQSYPVSTLTTGKAAKLIRTSQQTVIRQFDLGAIPGYHVLGCSDRRIILHELHHYANTNELPFMESTIADADFRSTGNPIYQDGSTASAWYHDKTFVVELDGFGAVLSPREGGYDCFLTGASSKEADQLGSFDHIELLDSVFSVLMAVEQKLFSEPRETLDGIINQYNSITQP